MDSVDFPAPRGLETTTTTSPIVRLVEGEGEAPDHPHGVFPQNWGVTEPNRTITCMVLKSKANARRKSLATSREEFRGEF
ncbi:hypothetical protein TNCV_64301 [Trichonephila clavipes]|nr:hypothetical protein TNCV_64301 [Trichonephila clavipes]